MENFKISKTDHQTQKELLNPYLFRRFFYNDKIYIFIDFFECKVNDKITIECILKRPYENAISIPIYEMFKVYYHNLI